MKIGKFLTEADFGKSQTKRKFCWLPTIITKSGSVVWLEYVVVSRKVVRAMSYRGFGYCYKWTITDVQRLKYEETYTTTSVPSEEKESEGVRMVTYCAGKSETTFPEPFRK